MGRIATPLPLSQEIQSIYSVGGFSAGDYVYHVAGTGAGKLPSTQMLGAVTNVLAGALTPQGGVATATPSAQNGPTQIAGTYTGPTVAADAVLLAPVTETTDVVNALAVAGLINGNFVYLRRAGATVKFTIQDQGGATVVDPVTVTTTARNVTNNDDIGIVATADGGFVTAWQDTNGYKTLTKWDSAGTFVGSSASITSYTSASDTKLRLAALTNGNIVLCWIKGDNNYISYAVLSSSLATTVKAPAYLDTTYAAVTYPSYPMDVTALLNGQFVVAWYDGSYGACRKWFDGSGISQTSGQSFAGGNTNGVSICATTDGGYAIVSISSSEFYIARYDSTHTVVSNYSTSTGARMYAGGDFPPQVVALPGGFIAVYGIQNSSYGYYPSYMRQTGGTPSAPTFGSLQTLESVNAQGGGAVPAVCKPFTIVGGDRLLFSYATTTTNTRVTIRYSAGLTNGQLIYGVSILPPTYTLLGVALTDAPAGGSGKILVKGVASLNSNYRVVTASVAFDYTQFSGIAGNRGTAIGRTVTLKGQA